MTKGRLFRIVALTMALAMVMAMVGCSKAPAKTTDPTDAPSVTYMVKVVNRAGTAMQKCAVEVFSDAEKTTLVYKGIADKEGQITFSAPESEKYVAVISKVPMGYAVEEQYALAGERTDIVLVPAVLNENALDTAVLSLGDAMMDFNLTLTDGSEIALSQLLTKKKAVVLNFWFMNCEPCKKEFPYIQEGYQQLVDEIEVVAMNPVDSTDSEIAKFRTDKGYTFTMSKCDFRWQQLLQLQAYPTTVVIDRYGNICLIHRGGIESTQEFVDMVNYFIQDDYKQQFFKSAGQIPAVND